MNLELQTGYIADAIIDVKSERFGERFTSIQEVLIMQKLIERRLKKKGLRVTFIDAFFSDYFRVDNDVITKCYESETLKNYIGNREIRKTIYDDNFIYYCLCQMLINKLNNSINRTCVNCATNTTSECKKLLLGKNPSTKSINCDRWTYNIVEACANNIDKTEQSIIEKAQEKGPVKKLKRDNEHMRRLRQIMWEDFSEDK